MPDRHLAGCINLWNNNFDHKDHFKIEAKMEKKNYWNPYLAGIGLGITLLLAFVLVGRGLGASGALMRFTAWLTSVFAPEHVNQNIYLAKYAGEGINPLKNWLVFEVIGVVVGGFISGTLAGRLKFVTEKGPRITNKTRWIFAFLGGGLMGYGARLAYGCTSGQALTGGATLALGSWAFMFAVFGGGYLMAYFVRRLWI
jgi:uncharacterized membrane protein YedE/YeeE